MGSEDKARAEPPQELGGWRHGAGDVPLCSREWAVGGGGGGWCGLPCTLPPSAPECCKRLRVSQCAADVAGDRVAHTRERERCLAACACCREQETGSLQLRGSMVTSMYGCASTDLCDRHPRQNIRTSGPGDIRTWTGHIRVSRSVECALYAPHTHPDRFSNAPLQCPICSCCTALAQRHV